MLRLSSCVLFVILLWPALPAQKPVNAGTPTRQKLTSPVEQENFSMVIFGDRTGGPESGLEVLEDAVWMANRLAPDFVMTVGDMVNGYNARAKWLEQMARFQRIMAGLDMAWYPVPGNHDVRGGKGDRDGNVPEYMDHVGPLYYSFDYRFAHLIALFSDEAADRRSGTEGAHFSKAQLAWLRKDLAATRAQIIFVFLHHPRWLGKPGKTNWPRLHKLLKEDGRVKAVFAGHIHKVRDDGVKDGIHYYTLATTGGSLSGPEVSAFHHINHVRVWRDRIEMVVIPVGNLLGPDTVLGVELDEMHNLGRSPWLRVDGPVRVDATGTTVSRVNVTLHNPTSRPLDVTGRFRTPRGWTVQHEKIDRTLQAGQTVSLVAQVTAAPFQNRRPDLELEGRLDYVLKSGRNQRFTRRQTVPFQLTGIDPALARTARQNQVLRLDGRSALRVDLPALKKAFTLECWVRGKKPKGRVGLAARTENCNFALFWTPAPCGSVYVEHRGKKGQKGAGYLTVKTEKAWDWKQWTHLALTYDGQVGRFFVNGRLQDKARGTDPVFNGHVPFFIGADPDRHGRAHSFFRGAIDDLRLSTVARYTADFTPPASLKTDPHTLLLLPFDGERDGIFLDASGRGHHAWPVGRPVRQAEDRPGAAGM